jgi:hypothetical protein
MENVRRYKQLEDETPVGQAHRNEHGHDCFLGKILSNRGTLLGSTRSSQGLAQALVEAKSP